MGQASSHEGSGGTADWKRQVRAFEKNTNGKMSVKDFKKLQQQIAFEYPAVASVHESMLITDNRLPDCPIVYANDQFERMTLYPKEKILGVNCRFLQGPLTDKGVVRQIGDAVRAGRALEVELLNYRADNIPFWNVFLMLPVHKQGKKSGKVEFFIAIQQDVSVIKGLRKEVDQWSAPEVCMWLEKHGLGYTVSRFLENRVEGHQLLTLNAEDLRALGFKLRADRQRIVQALQSDFDECGRYRFASGGADQAGRRELKPDVQVCNELDTEDDVNFEYWGEREIGVNDAERVTVKCFYKDAAPIVFLMPRSLTVDHLKRELRNRVGRKYKARFIDSEGDSYPLRTDEDLATALALADDHTVTLRLSKPAAGVPSATAQVLACVPLPLLCVDAFGLVVHANDAAHAFVRSDAMEETAVERWIAADAPGESLHSVAGCALTRNVHRTDDTVERCDVNVQLSSPGFAVVTFSPASGTATPV